MSSSFGGNGGSGGRQQQQQSFSFPMLSNEEILMCMAELQIPLEEEDLEKPTARSVRTVYEALCETCMGITKEEIHNPSDELLEEIQFPELHEDSIPQFGFFRAVSKLMQASGVHDTRVWDIIKPDGKRFRRNMSAVINFAKFREERLINFTELSNKTEELLERKHQVDEACEVVESQIKQIEAEREAEKPEIEKLERDCKDLEAQISQCNKEQAKLKYDANLLKQSGSEMRDQVATLQFQRLNTRQESERIQKNIVRSPERLRRELKEQQGLLEEDKNESGKTEKTLRELQEKFQAVLEAEEDASMALEMMQDVEENMIKCKEANKEKKRMESSIQDHSATMRQLETNLTEMERQSQIMHDRLARLRKQVAIKSEAAKNTLNTVSQEKANLEAERAQIQNELSQCKEKINETKQAIEAQRFEKHQVLEKKKSALKRLEDRVFQASERLLKEITNSS